MVVEGLLRSVVERFLGWVVERFFRIGGGKFFRVSVGGGEEVVKIGGVGGGEASATGSW